MADFKINITGDASGAVGAAAQATTGLNQTAAATAKVADEAERYQAALQKMAEAQAMVSEKATSAEDVAMLEKSSRLQEEITKRKEQEAARIAFADYDIAAGVKNYTKEEIAAMEQTTAATAKAVSMKVQLKEAVKGLAFQFPQLAAVARLAFNPITLAISGIIGAFSIWKQRVDGMTQALAGFELPQVSERTVQQVNAAATAWGNLATALKAASDNYNSVGAATDRYLVKLGAESDQKRRLLAAERDLALAVLEKDKDKLKGGEYEKRKLQIENNFATRSLALTEEEKRKELAAKRNREANLGLSAASKFKEASGIHLASAEQDAETEKALKENADAAHASIEVAKEWQGRIVDMASSKVDALKWSIPYQIRYGYDRNGYGIEAENIKHAQFIIDSYNAFKGRKAGRDDLRARRGQLYSEGTSEAAESLRLSSSLTDEEAAAAAESGVSRRVAGMQNTQRAVGTLGNLSDEAQRRAADVQKFQAELARMVAAGTAITPELLQTMRQLTTDLKDVGAAVRLMRQQFPNLR